jgi:hypothetical protein
MIHTAKMSLRLLLKLCYTRTLPKEQQTQALAIENIENEKSR